MGALPTPQSSMGNYLLHSFQAVWREQEKRLATQSRTKRSVLLLQTIEEGSLTRPAFGASMTVAPTKTINASLKSGWKKRKIRWQGNE